MRMRTRHGSHGTSDTGEASHPEAEEPRPHREEGEEACAQQRRRREVAAVDPERDDRNTSLPRDRDLEEADATREVDVAREPRGSPDGVR